jgi:hypothetical protein
MEPQIEVTIQLILEKQGLTNLLVSTMYKGKQNSFAIF